ncbi:MAG: hypothetical protein ACYDGN_16905 [Acidimicrobiales bacterium]
MRARTIAAPESVAIVVSTGAARDVANGDGFSQSTSPIVQSTHAPDASTHTTTFLVTLTFAGRSSGRVGDGARRHLLETTRIRVPTTRL